MNDVTINELIAIGFKNAYSSFHDNRYIYNLRKGNICVQWDSMFENEIVISHESEESGVIIPIKGMSHLKRIVGALLNSEQNPERSVATEDDSSNADGNQKV